MVWGDAAPLSAVVAGRDGGSDGVMWSHHRDPIQGTGELLPSAFTTVSMNRAGGRRRQQHILSHHAFGRKSELSGS